MHPVTRREDDEHKLRHELIEIAEAVLLAIVAVATAWSGYQSTLWDSKQAHLYGVSSRDRALATQSATLAGQQQLYDSNVFSFWLQANAARRRQAAGDLREALPSRVRRRLRGVAEDRSLPQPESASRAARDEAVPERRDRQGRRLQRRGDDSLRRGNGRPRDRRQVRPRHRAARDGAVPDRARPAVQGARPSASRCSSSPGSCSRSAS